MRPWWEQFPGRLEYELDALRRAGIRHSVDEHLRSAGVIAILATAVVGNEEIRVRAVFPDTYPFMRFEVYAAELELPHHQNPVHKNLCFLGADSGNWRVHDTLASFLVERLPLVLQAARADTPDARRGVEIQQAEPSTSYLSYEPNGVVLVDSSWSIPSSANEGILELCARSKALPLRAAVHRIKLLDGSLVAESAWALRSAGAERITARWMRLSHGVRVHDGKALIAEIESRSRKLRRDVFSTLDGQQVDVVGLLFSEETSWTTTGDAWVFFCRTKKRGGALVYTPLRAGRAGAADFSARVPELTLLQSRVVSVIGVGGIGAPSAIEFAKAGVGELRIIDGDYVEAGTAVRYPVGIDYAGRPKASALADFIGRNYPHTKVAALNHRIGAPPGDTRDRDVLPLLVRGSDLLFDATAERGTGYLVSELAREHDVPYVSASTTHGAWGGLVARVRGRQADGCWTCLQLHLRDETIPPPPADPSGSVQPRGCAAITFTGTGFDVAQVALLGVRHAVSTLMRGIAGGYPDVEWDVGVLKLRDHSGRPQFSFETYPLGRHPECPQHTS